MSRLDPDQFISGRFGIIYTGTPIDSGQEPLCRNGLTTLQNNTSMEIEPVACRIVNDREHSWVFGEIRAGAIT